MGGKAGSFGKDHAEYVPYEDLHHSAGGFDGGKCVGAHEYYYKQRDSCSYRWQAHHRATTSDKGLYGQTGTQVSSPSPGQAATLLRNRALAIAPGPLKVSKGGRAYRKVTGQPFRTAFAPWPNNPHHLLPDAQLKNGIFQMAAGLPTVQDMIVQGLLNNAYNINHWKNMMILPQREKEGCALSLPTHPQGDSHPAYSATVRDGVDLALQPYGTVVQQVKAGKPHDVPDPVDIKGALETLSGDLHAAVLALRPTVAAKCASSSDISIGGFASAIATSIGV
jgi:A nuclease family of the HNH/ENDO VII superfamily with conserved AHH